MTAKTINVMLPLDSLSVRRRRPIIIKKLGGPTMESVNVCSLSSAQYLEDPKREYPKDSCGNFFHLHVRPASKSAIRDKDQERQYHFNSALGPD